MFVPLDKLKCKGCVCEPRCYFSYEDLLGTDCHECRHPRSQHFRMGPEYSQYLLNTPPGKHVNRPVPGIGFHMRLLDVPFPHLPRPADACPPPIETTPYQRSQIIKQSEATASSLKGNGGILEGMVKVIQKATCRRCGIVNRVGAKPKVCGRCRLAVYCTVTCQRVDWAEHKLTCVAPAEVSVSLRAAAGDSEKQLAINSWCK
jgi:hypothetical protein